MKVINLKGLFELEPIFFTCFRCGDKKYNEVVIEGNLYRICAKCMKSNKVKKFMKERYGITLQEVVKIE